jgi:hypothetical protein
MVTQSETPRAGEVRVRLAQHGPARRNARRAMTRRAVVTALVVAVVIGGLAPRMATAQWGRPGWRVGVEQGGALARPYGYPGPSYQAPPPGGYAAPGGYATPPGGYGGVPPGQGYPPPGYASPGYPAPSYAPPAYQPTTPIPSRASLRSRRRMTRASAGRGRLSRRGSIRTLAGSWAGGASPGRTAQLGCSAGSSGARSDGSSGGSGGKGRPRRVTSKTAMAGP